MKKSKNQIIIAIYVLILVTLILLGFTYAYYKTRINGNTKDKSISVVSKKLEITYADGNGEITSNDFEQGSKITKTFSVKNTGDEEIYYSIALEDVINTFTRIEDIKYTLKKGEETIGTGHLPSVDKTIAFKEKINKNETNEYSLIVEYLNLDEDQSIDMGSTLSLLVQIKDSEEVIEISNAEQLKALSRITNSEFQTSSYTIDNDLQILGIDKINNSDQDTLKYILSSSYRIENDIEIEFNRSFGSDFFFGIGSMYNSFSGNFYGNNKKITVVGIGDYTFNAYVRTLALINNTINSSITDLTVELNSSILSDTAPVPLYMSLLVGISKNTNYDNITLNLNDSNFGVSFNKDKSTTMRNMVHLGLLTSIIQGGCDIQNVNININNSNILAKTIENNTETSERLTIGLISSSISTVKDKRVNVKNVNVKIKNSNVENYTTQKGYLGGVAGYASYTTMDNVNFELKNSALKIYSDATSDLTGYTALSVGGFIGFGEAGSKNTEDTIGDEGVIIKNSSFVSDNTDLIDVISAKEIVGGSYKCRWNSWSNF